MFRIVFTNENDSERSTIGYDSEEAANEAGRKGVAVGAGWTDYHLVYC